MAEEDQSEEVWQSAREQRQRVVMGKHCWKPACFGDADMVSLTCGAAHFTDAGPIAIGYSLTMPRAQALCTTTVVLGGKGLASQISEMVGTGTLRDLIVKSPITNLMPTLL
jgi:hypothetical protein